MKKVDPTEKVSPLVKVFEDAATKEANMQQWLTDKYLEGYKLVDMAAASGGPVFVVYILELA